ncbi:MAG: TIGR04282 family arsenosugar biosynthesis glycosyltransferase [Phormidesmis sp.]
MKASTTANTVTGCGLFLFTRFPQPGHTKTRLIPSLGAVGAAILQRQMSEHLLRRFEQLSQQLTLQVHFAGGTMGQMRKWLGEEHQLVCQCEGDLGDRLIFALDQGFASGLQRIVVVGSDCPDLGTAEIMAALTLLDSHDVVLGPATDGGYYLIGLNRVCQPSFEPPSSEPLSFESLFRNIPWGTARVLETTKAIATRQDFSVALLNPLSDIDRPEDLLLWNTLSAAPAAHVRGANRGCQ